MDTPIPFRGQITKEIFCLTQVANSGFMQRIGTILPAALVLYGVMIWSANRDLKFIIIMPAAAVVIFLLRKQLLDFINGLRYGSTAYDECVFAGELGEEGLLLKDDEGELTIAWSEITHFKSAPGLLLLYKAPGVFHVIHRSHFASEQAWAEAEQLVRRKISKGA